MELKVDADNFMLQQEVFTGEMIARIAEHLERAGIKGDLLKELTGNISFEVASMIDSSSSISFDGDEAHPYLAFLSCDSDNELVHLGGNSTCHEMVYGILNAMFEDSI